METEVAHDRLVIWAVNLLFY